MAAAQTVRLDATAQGRPVYERLGFVAEYEVARLVGTPACRSEPVERRRLKREQLAEVAALDRQATGTDRQRLLERLYLEYRDQAWTCVRDGRLLGYALARPGRRARFLGPCVALTPDAGRDLLQAACLDPERADAAGNARETSPGATAAATGRCSSMCPATTGRRPAGRREAGLIVQRSFVRMYRGQPVSDRRDQIWASSGPEKG